MTSSGLLTGNKILIYCPFSKGGLSDYAHLQANALKDHGVDVEMLVSQAYPEREDRRYRLFRELIEPDLPNVRKGLWKSFGYFYRHLQGFYRLKKFIQREQITKVLLISYFEYLAPFWVPMLKALDNQGVVFGAMVHEPIRDFVVGPQWWHRYCIRRAYSFIREAFVHEEISLDTGGGVIPSRVTLVPQGTFKFPKAQRSRSELREFFGIPLAAPLMLSFGHIRDNKNLDLLIQAMQGFPDVYLLVAGATQSSRQRDERFYRELADRCGVANRCRWDIRHVPMVESADYFESSDLVALPYRSSFLSASGVLSVAVGFRKPALVSSGEGCLKQVMRDYPIGYWVEPDDLKLLEQGISEWIKGDKKMNWDGYLKDHSWAENAKRVSEKMFAIY